MCIFFCESVHVILALNAILFLYQFFFSIFWRISKTNVYNKTYEIVAIKLKKKIYCNLMERINEILTINASIEGP